MSETNDEPKLIMKKGQVNKLMDNRIDDFKFTQRVLGFNLATMRLGNPGKPKSVPELQERVDAYLELSHTWGLPPTVEGLALATSYDRKTLYDIETNKAKIPFSDTIKKAKDFIANYDAMMATSNKVNAAVYCFRSKNMYGMKDVQEIKAAPMEDASKPQDVEDILNALPEKVDQGNTTLEAESSEKE